MATRERREPTFGQGEAEALVLPEPWSASPGPSPFDLESIREAHIGHERQLKAVGLLYGIGAVGTSALLLAIVLPRLAGSTAADFLDPAFLLPALLVLTLAIYMGAAAYGFRRLRPWVAYVGTPLAVLGLTGVPIGTLVNGYILYLVWGRKGRRVLGRNYGAIVQATPHVRYRYTAGDWVVIGLLAAFITGIAVLSFYLI